MQDSEDERSSANLCVSVGQRSVDSIPDSFLKSFPEHKVRQSPALDEKLIEE